MEVFLHYITSFPVVIYTFLLAIIICYWILAMIGAVDIDIFDLDVDIDTDIDTSVDVDAQGLSGVTGFMLKWGLTGVPVTVVVSILIATAWLICYVTVSLLYPLLPWETLRTLAGLALLVISFACSIIVTAQLIKPIKGLFISHNAANKASFIGRECVVKTGSVTSTFGQAVLEDGGAGMIFDVRADEALNIKKGDLVILMEYDEVEGCYQVYQAKKH